ncbi:hypothetical protein BQ9231_00523 [Cedratvirus lausannensis]|uniref:Uncharacterized protein n=1 Tax=Cedratvirus lausannensis TaxID=2023205 RepID=A0A285PYY8_9VIRU|nr:hypothetical protein BQ9231_00523 [Cedratvirus lausannensis]
MKSLKGTVLSTFSYTQTQKLCAEHPTAVDCDWDLWREKAMADFAISGEFFDLVPQLPGSQRYLQIKSYHVLTPDMAVKVYPDGFIEGVYEAYAGYLKALVKNDTSMRYFFSSRLKDKQVAELVNQEMLSLPLQPLSQEFINTLNSKKDYSSDYSHFVQGALEKALRGEGDRSTFLFILSSGRTDWIDLILHEYFVLPEGFSIEENIDYVPFWAEEFPIYELPLYPGEWYDAQNILSAAIRGANVKVIDFLRSVFRDKLDMISPIMWESAKQALDIQKKPEEVFGIYRRFRNVPQVRPFMVEQALDLKKGFFYLVEKKLGNVPDLLVSLPFLTGDEFALLRARLAANYPLSDRIIHEYLIQ